MDISSEGETAQVLGWDREPSLSVTQKFILTPFSRVNLGETLPEVNISSRIPESARMGMSLLSSRKRTISLGIRRRFSDGWEEGAHVCNVEET